MTKSKKEDSFEEIEARALQAEAAYRKLRTELMTPAEVEYIWDKFIIPRLQGLKELLKTCDGERAEESAISLLVREATEDYIRQREERRDLGLPPLCPDDLDKPREDGNEPNK